MVHLISFPPIQRDQGDWQSSNYSNWYRYQSFSCVRWNTDKILCSYHMRKAITPTGTLSAFHLTREIAVSSHNTGYVTMAMKLRDNYHNRHHEVVSLLGAPLGQLWTSWGSWKLDNPTCIHWLSWQPLPPTMLSAFHLPRDQRNLQSTDKQLILHHKCYHA